MKILWLTGLSGSGKTTIATHLATHGVIVLDGDELRSGLNSDLGFSIEDRTENVRRVAEVAKQLSKNSVVAVALITPLESMRKLARRIIGEEYIEIYCSAPLELCEQRDVKGLYKKARDGKLPQFTGIGAEYEVPSKPDLILDTSKTIEESISMIVGDLSCDAYSVVLGFENKPDIVLRQFGDLPTATLARTIISEAMSYSSTARSLSVIDNNGDALVYQNFETGTLPIE